MIRDDQACENTVVAGRSATGSTEGIIAPRAAERKGTRHRLTDPGSPSGDQLPAPAPSASMPQACRVSFPGNILWGTWNRPAQAPNRRDLAFVAMSCCRRATGRQG